MSREPSWLNLTREQTRMVADLAAEAKRQEHRAEVWRAAFSVGCILVGLWLLVAL